MDKKASTRQKTSSGIHLSQKDPQNITWNKKYITHGDSSDIVADIGNTLSGHINSSVPEDIDLYLADIHDIATKADAILNSRLSKISSLEQQTMNQIIKERQNIIGAMIAKGRSKMDEVEGYYGKVIEEFIAKLEIEMSKHLDSLQKQIETNKESVLSTSTNKIADVTKKSQHAKKECLQLLDNNINVERQKLLGKITEITKDKTNQNLGYEHLRLLDMKIYATVGKRSLGQEDVNMSGKDKFIKDIDEAKSNQPVKKLVYVGTGNTPIESH